MAFLLHFVPILWAAVASAAFHTTLTTHQAGYYQKAVREPLTKHYGGLLSSLADFWEEIIEFSTLGPGERKLKRDRERLLHEAKEREAEYNEKCLDDDFRKVKAAMVESSEDLSLDAFNAVVALETIPDVPNKFGGYELRDLLVEKWGAPLDVSFTRVGAGSNLSVYCNIMPVPYGSRRCQHNSEIDYLMHLQSVTEILDRYKNLSSFIAFIEATERTPRSGTFVSFQLELSPEQLKKVNRE